MATDFHLPDNPTPPPPAPPPAPQLPAISVNPPPKRQRRPSVRLGEIGDQPATLRTKPHWSHSHAPSKPKRNFGAKRVRSNWSGAETEFGELDISESDRDTSVEVDALNYRECNGDRVRAFLSELGLSRYMPVFEIHEVDDDVLPFLTLEDLRDMGITAVGSRRKLFNAIQRLRRTFSS